MPQVDVLIPTFNRNSALAVTMTSLCFQTFSDFSVTVSDQNENQDVGNDPLIKAVQRILESYGKKVNFYKNLPRQGMAQQRQFLTDKSTSQYSLFLDDDLILEPFVLANMVQALEEEGCGFVGQAVIGLSFIHDIRPAQQLIEFWSGHVEPEVVRPGMDKWNRHLLHNAANIYHVQQDLSLTPQTQKKYKVAWIGGCVMYDTQKLKEAGGYSFWQNLPQKHAGEDVMAQLKVMEEYGGCGLIPSGVYHQELPTTVPERDINVPEFLDF